MSIRLSARLSVIVPFVRFKFSMQDIKSYAQNCEHTQELYHHKSAPGKCADNSEQKELRILDVTNACCNQGGKFVCQDGVPWKCNVSGVGGLVPPEPWPGFHPNPGLGSIPQRSRPQLDSELA